MKKYIFNSLNPFLILAAAVITFLIMTMMRAQVDELKVNQTYILPLNLSKSEIFIKKELVNRKKTEIEKVFLPHYRYQVQFGDNLDNIFKKLNIPSTEKQKILKTDKSKEKLQKLKVGDELNFWLSKNDKDLAKFEVGFHPSLKLVFKKESNKRYNLSEVKTKNQWKQKVAAGKIVGNFSISANKAGLSYNEIDLINKILSTRVNLNKDLRVGDKFAVIRLVQMQNGKATGKSEIEAVKIETQGKTYSAYLHVDGNHYDANGNPVSRTFLRYPTKKKYKVSSHFNLDRKHPISKIAMPHKGTDFYANMGTKVIATADGVVKVSRYHAKAGHYLVIDHGDDFFTRYLHNSKLLVKRGQSVKKGQIIAMSGKSGKVTGPHIHYELWAKGKPVNPIKAIFPSHQAVPKFQLPLYRQLVRKYDEIMKLAKATGKLEGGLQKRYQDRALVMREKN